MASALPVPADCCDDCTCPATVTISNTIGWFVADTLLLMRAITTQSSNKSVLLNGRITPFDGLGGDYGWSATSAAADNGTTIIRPNDLPATGRWIKVP